VEGECAVGKNELEFEQRVTAEQGAALLEQIAGGLRSGILELTSGDEKIRLSPAQIVKLELEASSADDKQKLVVELKWHVNEVRALTEEAQLQVASAPSV
jgi:amphi-Trp domain-containing protein